MRRPPFYAPSRGLRGPGPRGRGFALLHPVPAMGPATHIRLYPPERKYTAASPLIGKPVMLPGPPRPRAPRQGFLPLHPVPAMVPEPYDRLLPACPAFPQSELPGKGKRLGRRRENTFSPFGGPAVFQARSAPWAAPPPARERLPASKDRGSREVTSLVRGLGAEEAPKRTFPSPPDLPGTPPGH